MQFDKSPVTDHVQERLRRARIPNVAADIMHPNREECRANPGAIAAQSFAGPVVKVTSWIKNR